MIDDVKKYTEIILIINDGSTVGSLDVIRGKNVDFFSFDTNQGKGAALKKGFEIAYSKGYDYAITIDADGQHYAEDIPKFIDKLHNSHKNTLIIGIRQFGNNVSGRTKFGKNLSNVLCSFFSARKIKDAQSGFRLYPLKEIVKLKTIANRYDFEVEVIVKAMWRNIYIDHIPVKVLYEEPDKRISHFDAFYDNVRTSLNFFMLGFLSVFMLPVSLLKRIFIHK